MYKRQRKTVDSSSTAYIGSLYEVSGSLITKYIFAGPKRIASVESTGDTYYYHSDHLGSSNLITSQSGAQKGLTEFMPYGAVSKYSGTYSPKFKFTGKELDNTGFYFYGARYYDPQIARFITADTIIQAPFDPQSLNRYSYCRNNPLIYTDPTGHSFMGAVGSFFGAIGSFIGGMFSAIGGFFSGFFGGAFGRGGGGSSGSSGGSSGSSAPSLPSSSRGGSGSSSSEVSNNFISGAWNLGASVGSVVGGAFKAGTLNIGGAGYHGLSNWLGGSGFRTDLGVIYYGYGRQIEMIRALCGNMRDVIVEVISRPLSGNKTDPGSTTGPRHNAIISDILPQGKWEMGPNPESPHMIETTNTIQNLAQWGTHITTERSIALGGSYARSFGVAVNSRGINEAIGVYETTIVGKIPYNALNHNSNYAVNLSLIHI